jgi:putative endonuclease
VENPEMHQRKNQQTGQLGEDCAVAHLLQQGFILLERNWRYSHLEIDIIAQQGQTLHFVEVKTLYATSGGLPEWKVNRKKINNMKRAAEAYLFLHPQWRFIQFDVVAITFQPPALPDIFVIEDLS